jgi:2-polyprenyl-3-methyl-5-hydroxy-6-metoxy-1,4-benzoquinol methylase
VADTDVMAALTRAEDRHFWHLARNRFIVSRLRRLAAAHSARVLELGCGGGCVSAALARSGWAVTGVDGHLSRIRQAAARAPAATFVVHDLERGLEPLGGERWEVVGLFDVLEHLSEPAAALRSAAGAVVPGGLIVGTVPALMALWSDVDVRSGHRVRFGRTTLESLLRSVPVEVLEIVDFNRLLVPMLWLQRRAVARSDALEQGLKVPWAPINAALDYALRVEQWLTPLLSTLAFPGASLWFAARVR